MSMKRFLSRSSNKKTTTTGAGETPPTTAGTSSSFTSELVPTISNHSGESHDSIKDLRPMFNQMREGQSSSANQYDMMHLNLNPTILNTTKVASSTKGSTIQESVFSSRQSYSTKQSSYQSDVSAKRKLDFAPSQPLQILNILEENEHQNLEDLICDNLKQLSQDLSYVVNQFNNSTINLSTAVINTIDCLKKFIAFIEKAKYHEFSNTEFCFTAYNSSSVRKILKIYLHMYDNLLRDDVYIKLKLLLVKNFNEFALVLNHTGLDSQFNANPGEMIKPKNYAIGTNRLSLLPNEEVLIKIMDRISQSSLSTKEQNGAFIAPITRGISKDLNILCLYFGYPDPKEYHYNLVQGLQGLYEEIHIILMKDQIELASSKEEAITIPPAQKFKLPFRVPTEGEQIPMSMSLSIEKATRTSGTVGGYIHPIIDLEKQPHLKSYANSKFAVSCGHVCLDSEDPENYPNVSSPSSVLISLYKDALTQQYHKSLHNNAKDSKAAFGAMLQQLESMFPLKKISQDEVRNLPKVRFGQIIWGERTLLTIGENDEINQVSGVVEKKLSDLAIIKLNKNLKCECNYLGDDVPFNEYDPALMFDNLYVKKVLDLKRYAPKMVHTDIHDVDSDISNYDSTINNNYYGLEAFKMGATTKYTRGCLNGIKIVYWMDGQINSLEFVVSLDTTFASGGDSGSWLLTKLEDGSGLGVLGMLHSYDGQVKQFGLFTPMSEILDRLETVTGIKWSVL